AGGAYPGGTAYGGARQFGAATGVGGVGTPGGASPFGGGSRTGFGQRLNQAVAGAIGRAGGGGGDFAPIGQYGPTKILPDERSNALLVFADRRDLPMISNIIAKLDVVLPQVLIEALILEVNLGDS